MKIVCDACHSPVPLTKLDSTEDLVRLSCESCSANIEIHIEETTVVEISGGTLIDDEQDGAAVVLDSEAVDLDVDGASRVLDIEDIFRGHLLSSSIEDGVVAGDAADADSDGPDSELRVSRAVQSARSSIPGLPVEKSMLIHLEHLRLRNRRVRVFALAATAAVLLLGVGIWFVIYRSNLEIEASERSRSERLSTIQGEELSSAEVQRVAPLDGFSVTVLDSEVEWADGDGFAPVGSPESRSTPPSRIGKSGASMAPASSEPPRERDGAALRPAAGAEARTIDRKTSKKSTKSGTDGAPARRSSDTQGVDSSNVGSTRHGSGASRKLPGATPDPLYSVRKDLARSVKNCQKKQQQRGRPMTGKIRVRLVIESDGRVSSMKIENLSEKGSLFEECLRGKVEGMVFTNFEGKKVELKQTLVLGS